MKVARVTVSAITQGLTVARREAETGGTSVAAEAKANLAAAKCETNRSRSHMRFAQFATDASFLRYPDRRGSNDAERGADEAKNYRAIGAGVQPEGVRGRGCLRPDARDGHGERRDLPALRKQTGTGGKRVRLRVEACLRDAIRGSRGDSGCRGSADPRCAKLSRSARRPGAGRVPAAEYGNRVGRREPAAESQGAPGTQ